MFKSIGFPKSDKDHEKRIALLPHDIEKMDHKEFLFFENKYGELHGITDEEYVNAGANICCRQEVLKKDIICDPKIGDATYLKDLKDVSIFGWIHAVQNKNITDLIVNNRLTAFAWEDMYFKGRHIFWRNNEIAGEAAILHAFMEFGILPYECNIALIGRGNTARGALKILTMFGAQVTVFDKYTEKLLREEISQFDVVVNCVLWDTTREDHLVYLSDLKKMKKGSLIIDVSCDKNGGIESSRPTTIDQPIFSLDNIGHYAVDHTPTIFYKSTSKTISANLPIYLEQLMKSEYDKVLEKSKIIDQGHILDERINIFQKRDK